jgi:hypothetical protein
MEQLKKKKKKKKKETEMERIHTRQLQEEQQIL